MARALLFILLAICCTGCATTSHGVGDQAFLEKSRGELGRRLADWQAVPVDSWTKQATPLTGTWEIADTALTATEGKGNRTVLLMPMPGDAVRLRFEARLTSEHEKGWIGDISILVGVIADEKKYWTSGYVLTSGSYWNNCTTFYRLGKGMARTETSPLRPGVWHVIDVEVAKGVLRYQVDGRVILEARDVEPLAIADGERFIGLRTWETRLEVRGVEVSISP